MFTSKLAPTLSKAMAGRSSAEIVAAAATMIAAATAVSNSNSSTCTDAQEQSQQDSTGHSSSANSNVQSRLRPSFDSLYSLGSGPASTTISSSSTSSSTSPMKTSCEALHATAPTGGTHRFSRLARRRTIQRMKASKTRATLSSKYQFVETSPPLGEGAFGSVFVGRHRQSGEPVAIKKIPKQFTSDLSFQNEMDALMAIRQHGGHPNICSLRENFEEGDYYYLVLDLVSGGEMFDHLCKQGPYSEADAARLVREVASALAFQHGIGLVHGDLKPENLMLSSENPLHAVIKIVDFGCAQVIKNQDTLEGETPANNDRLSSILHVTNTIANTPAYCPPEILDKDIRQSKGPENYNKLNPSFDMWALGVILYIMLTGMHPFDLDGTATDEEVEQKIVRKEAPPLRDSPLTVHLSDSAISVMERLMHWNPESRLTAHQMLDDPWVRGETALRTKMANSDKKLSLYKAYKSKLEAKVFADMVQWSENPGAQQTSLLERAFHNLDGSKRGYISKSDLRRLSGHKDKEPTVSLPCASSPQPQATSAAVTNSTIHEEDLGDHGMDLSAFSELLSDNMKNRYYPAGHIVYREGDHGDQMFFINSGTIQVTTSDGHHSTRTQGDTFGEGALLNKSETNTSTIKCVTPVHAIEISRQYFEKFLNNGEDMNAKIHLSEKDKTRKRERAVRLLRNQPQMNERTLQQGEAVFPVGDTGDDLFILEDGKADVVVDNGKQVFSLEPGEMCGDHSVAFGRPRNTSAICASKDGCRFRMLKKADFERVLEQNPWWVKKSIRDISLRREFQKAIVAKTNKAFPATDEAALRQVFELADDNRSGKLELENVRAMLHAFDKSFTDEDVKEILEALDLDESGGVSFDEFKRMFAARSKSCSGSV